MVVSGVWLVVGGWSASRACSRAGVAVVFFFLIQVLDGFLDELFIPQFGLPDLEPAFGDEGLSELLQLDEIDCLIFQGTVLIEQSNDLGLRERVLF